MMSDKFWCVYYGDDTSFSINDGSPFDAPKRDVQIIEQNGELLFYHDYYLWRTDLEVWVPCNGADGLLDMLTAYMDKISSILIGRYMPYAQWNDLLQKVKKNSLVAFNARQLEFRGVDLND